MGAHEREKKRGGRGINKTSRCLFPIPLSLTFLVKLSFRSTQPKEIRLSITPISWDICMCSFTAVDTILLASEELTNGSHVVCVKIPVSLYTPRVVLQCYLNLPHASPVLRLHKFRVGKKYEQNYFYRSSNL